MPCNGCQALRGPLVQLVNPVTITTTGFTLQELLRVTIPPLDDPVKLCGIIRPASLLTATTVNMAVALAPAGASALNSIDGDARTNYPFTDVNPQGHYTFLQAWVELPGDYILAAVKTSGNGQAYANALAKTSLWWER